MYLPLSLKPSLNPRNIMIDYERAALNAFAMEFSNTEIKDCFFHMLQCVWRQVQELFRKYMCRKIRYERKNNTTKVYNQNVKLYFEGTPRFSHHKKCYKGMAQLFHITYKSCAPFTLAVYRCIKK